MIYEIFFKPTPLYKEYSILDLIEKKSTITQREISEKLGIAVSMVNIYLDTYEEEGYISRNYLSQKNVEYLITKKGLERKKILNIGYLQASQILYNSAKDNIEKFLIQLQERGFVNILLYGAGEVAEILLQTIRTNKTINLNVLAIVDDDLFKQDQELLEKKIIDKKNIKEYLHDGILISSYNNKEIIKKRLYEIDYPKDKIVEFFE